MPEFKKKSNRTPLMILIVVGLFIILTQLSTFLFAPNPEKDSWGKILLPVAESINNNKIIVIGETQDIASGQYIWLAVKKPGDALCRPKKRVLRNTRFRATIFVENIKKTATLSIYVLDKAIHHQWSEWKEKKSSKGLGLPPDKRRLDSVTLKFKS